MRAAIKTSCLPRAGGVGGGRIELGLIPHFFVVE